MSKTDKKRANSIITVSRFDGKLQFTVLGCGTLVLDPNTASAENRSRMMYHGGEQRVRDAAALSVNRETGKSATPQEKFEAMKRIVDHLNNPQNTEWSIRPAANPGLDAGLTLTAMMRALGKSLDEVEAIIAATMAKRGIERTPALKLWADSKQVAQAILDIKRERADKGADVDDLLDDIMGDGGPDDQGGEGEDEEALM